MIKIKRRYSAFIERFMTPEMDPLERSRATSLVWLIVICLIYTFITYPLSWIVGTHFPFELTIIMGISMLTFFYFTKARVLTANILCAVFFGIFVLTATKSGGLYSGDLGYIFIICIIAIATTNLTSSLFWIVASIVAGIVFYILAKDPAIEALYKEQFTSFTNEYFLTLVIAGTIIPSIFMFIFDRLNKSLVSKLTNINKALDISNDQLKSQQQELKLSGEKLSAANKKLERYAYSISHDLREPARTINSFSQLLERELDKGDPDPGQVEEFMDFIKMGVVRMDTKIEEILNFARLSNIEQYVIEDLNKTMMDICNDLDQQINESSADINFNQLPTIKAIPGTIGQVFQNLISNAIKYGKQGEQIKVDIKSEELPQHWQFSIADNGIGIPKEASSQVFENFQQLNNGNTGQGIGLATCKQIVNAYGGKIWVESKENFGSTFFFTLDKSKVAA